MGPTKKELAAARDTFHAHLGKLRGQQERLKKLDRRLTGLIERGKSSPPMGNAA